MIGVSTCIDLANQTWDWEYTDLPHPRLAPFAEHLDAYEQATATETVDNRLTFHVARGYIDCVAAPNHSPDRELHWYSLDVFAVAVEYPPAHGSTRPRTRWCGTILRYVLDVSALDDCGDIRDTTHGVAHTEWRGYDTRRATIEHLANRSDSWHFNQMDTHFGGRPTREAAAR